MRKEFNKYIEDRYWAFLMLLFTASVSFGYFLSGIYELTKQLLK